MTRPMEANLDMAEIPKVALLIETARGYGREMLRGIARYARLHGPWNFYLTPGDFEQAVPQMRRWGGTGIIARVETGRVAQAILEANLPTIALDLSSAQLSSENPLSAFSEIASDSVGAAGLAAEHLLERGFRHYAFVGIAGRIWSQRRQEGFCKRIQESGHSVRIYPVPRLKRDRSWDREQTILADWLRRLPKPAGLMACNDDRGREVLEASRVAGVQVPEELAVVGVDNDEVLCDVSDPPLSSVVLNAERGGYRAAALLDRMMQNQVRKPQRLLVEPLHVVARRSTDIVAIDDREVAAALRFIHNFAGRPIHIDQVVKHVAVSRRALELRFRKALGRTILAEIHRVRLERAKRLLLESELPIPKVAESAGFGTPSYLVQVFRQHIGMTPARYRKQMRSAEEE